MAQFILTLVILAATLLSASRFYETKDEHEKSQDAQNALWAERSKNIAAEAVEIGIDRYLERKAAERNRRVAP